jgi:hypothetical protein
MDILFHVATPNAARVLLPLARACERAGLGYACFFTNDGVLGLLDLDPQAALAGARRLVVCEESWHRFCVDTACPVEFGSQTANSALIGDAARVVSI